MGAPLNVFILYFMTSIVLTQQYRILGIFAFNGRSHNVMFTSLMKELVQRGHQVDDITHFPIKDAPPNYRVVINLNGTLASVVNNVGMDFVFSNLSDTCTIIASYGNYLCDLMSLQEIQTFIKHLNEGPSYDLLITEAFVANCFMGFGNLLKVPVIALCSGAEFPWITNSIGNNDNLAVISHILHHDFDRSQFWSRLKNVWSYYYCLYKFHKITEKYQTDIMRKYLGADMPNIRQVEKSIALTLVNRHPVIYGAKPISSSLIEVSGLHIENTPPKLSPEVQKWLDDSHSGLIYFTFGSMVLIESLAEETILSIYKFFSEITPMRGLIKIADKNNLPLGLPENVLTSPWISQQALLNHKNTRVFITHGGLMGCQEALYYEVPMIAIPLFGDQEANIASFVDKNMAIKINFNNLTTESLKWALNEILSNSNYKKNIKHYSRIFKDRPLSAIDTAVYWVEYVARNGPSALRSPALDLPWWQLDLLDVHAFLFMCLLCILISIYYLLKLVHSNMFTKKNKKLIKIRKTKAKTKKTK